MNKATFIIVLIICIATAIFFGLNGFPFSSNSSDPHAGHDHSDHGSCDGGHDHDEAENIVFTQKAKNLAGIKTDRAIKGKIDKKITIPGEISFNEDNVVHVVPRFGGVITKVSKKIGDYVKAGEEIASIESNESMVTYSVTSPINGQIIVRNISIGEFVSEEEAIFEIANMSDVWVKLSVYSNISSYVSKGQRVKISDLNGNIETEGTISYISPMVSNGTQCQTAIVVLSNRSGRYHPGLYVNAEISVDNGETLIVKKDAIQIIDGHETIFKVNDNGEYISADVFSGNKGEEYIQIVSGISEGELYVSEGAFEIKAHLVTKNLDPHAGHGH